MEVKKVAREVGTEGKLGVQAEVGNVQGIWQEITCVPFPSVFFASFAGSSCFFDRQSFRQHNGWQLDYTSPWFRTNFSGGYGWRFHEVHYGRG